MSRSMSLKSLKLGTALAAALVLSAPFGTALAGPDDNSLIWSAQKELTAADTYFDTSREAVVVAQHVYDGLVFWDQDAQEFKPLLATEWRQIDPLTR